MYSFLIRGGMVVNGSGRAPYAADVAVKGGKIVEIGESLSGPAEEVIEAGGLVTAPGFIDIHTHTDATIFAHPLADSKVLQGVTTDVTGNCGIGAFPVHPARKDALAAYLKIHDFHLPADALDWENFSGYADRVEKLGLGINLVPLMPHGSLRIAVMGADDRAPSSGEMERMEQLLAEGLEQGAWGLSTGLIYPPGSFAGTEELISLARVLARYRALYTSHIRGESAAVMQSIDEAVRIGRESGARIEISHLKIMGKTNWGTGREALGRIEQARMEGVDIGADQYPYEASSTSLAALLPAWAHDGGAAELIKRLAAADLRERLITDIRREMTVRGGPDRVMVAGGISSARNKVMSGKTVAQIAALWNCGPEEAVIRLLAEEDAAVGAVYFSMSADDVAAIMASGIVAVGSDGRGMHAVDDAAAATHPRSYGTFARVLGLYTREKEILSLEKAVHKMTGLPAARLGLTDRGLIKPGMSADITVFDPAAISDRAGFENPHQYAAGVNHVFVNGRPVVSGGNLTGQTPGRVLRKRVQAG
jgi:N-acyl-D-amino-acid deacylase